MPHAADEAARAAERRELLTGAIASIAIGLAMMAVMFWPGGTPWPMMDVNRWLLVPATIVQFVFGRRFLVAALRGARHGEANMNTLVAIGTMAAYGYSLVVTLLPESVMGAGLGHETYFDSAAVIIGLILLGRWLEARAKGQAAGAVKALMKLRPDTAQGAAARAASGRSRCARSSSATSCGCGRATECRSTACWSTARRPSTSRC